MVSLFLSPRNTVECYPREKSVRAAPTVLECTNIDLRALLRVSFFLARRLTNARNLEACTGSRRGNNVPPSTLVLAAGLRRLAKITSHREGM